jgi:hypothetical protein
VAALFSADAAKPPVVRESTCNAESLLERRYEHEVT